MTEQPTETPLEKLTMPVLRKALTNEGIKWKPTDKKVDLIKMLKAGETSHKPREQKRAPKLEDSKSVVALPVIPTEIREELAAMKEKGLKWEIDEASCSITFFGSVKQSCATLDQSSNNILRAATEVMSQAWAPRENGKRGAAIGEL